MAEDKNYDEEVERIKKIVEKILEEKEKEFMRRGYDIIQNPTTCGN